MTGIRGKGSFEGVLRRADGSEEVVRRDNMIVDAGFDLIFERLFVSQNDNTDNKQLRFVVVGTGANSAEKSQTKLTSFLSAATAQYFHTPGTKECKFVATFGTGVAIGAISEAAVCYCKNSSPTASNDYGIIDRVTFPVVNKGREDVYTATFKFVLGEISG